MASSVLVWSGCIYRKHLQEEFKASVDVLSKLGVEVRVLDREKCCGYPVLLAGYIEKAKELAEETYNKLRDYNCIVTLCPACLRAFKEFYPKYFGFKLRGTLHFTQYFLRELRGKTSLSLNQRMKVMSYDPCELARHLNIFDEPRRVISGILGVELYSQKYQKRQATCCGGGGLLPLFFPSLSYEIAVRKLFTEDRLPSHVNAIVTDCPSCIRNLRNALRNVGGDRRKTRVINTGQLLKLCLGGGA